MAEVAAVGQRHRQRVWAEEAAVLVVLGLLHRPVLAVLAATQPSRVRLWAIPQVAVVGMVWRLSHRPIMQSMAAVVGLVVPELVVPRCLGPVLEQVLP